MHTLNLPFIGHEVGKCARNDLQSVGTEGRVLGMREDGAVGRVYVFSHLFLWRCCRRLSSMF